MPSWSRQAIRLISRTRRCAASCFSILSQPQPYRPATISITTVGGDTLTITLAPSPASGTTVVPFINLPIQVAKVFATGTAGITTIVALWQ